MILNCAVLTNAVIQFGLSFQLLSLDHI